MKIYKYIATLRAKEPTGNKPTHYLKAKINQGDKDGEIVASLWSKEYTKDGITTKFLSGEMKSSWTDHTDPSKNREGWVIVNEKELAELIKKVNNTGDVVDEVTVDTESDIPF